jgi:Ca2+-binding EF-hand superfamily protein
MKGVDFTHAQLVKLKEYFDELDDDSNGMISADELEIPLVSMNICRNRSEVEDFMFSITGDRREQMHFGKFLTVIKGSAKGKNMDKLSPTNTFSELKSQKRRALSTARSVQRPYK